MTENSHSAGAVGSRIIVSKTGKEIDFIELWRGAGDQHKGRAGSWNGGFGGRPELAEALWPAIRNWAYQKGNGSVNAGLRALRTFWRFLDSYEAWMQTTVQFSDCNFALGSIWQNPPESELWAVPPPNVMMDVGKFLRRACELLGSAQSFIWPAANREDGPRKDIADRAQAKSALHLLKREARAIYARWAHADRLAAEGRNLLDCHRNKARHFGFKVTEADWHATYRAYITSSGNPLPDAPALLMALGTTLSAAKLWRRVTSLTALQAGLYPTLDDLCCLSQLVMARTGWNPSTTYSLDINNPDWAIRQPGKLDLYRIESFKERSNTWQDTVCRGRVTTGPYHIVTTLMDRTAPLRGLLDSDSLRLAGESIVKQARGSPWLAAGQAQYTGLVVTLKSDGTTGRTNTWWREKVSAHNRETAEFDARIDLENRKLLERSKGRSADAVLSFRQRKAQIPESMSLSDWRDIYAEFVFVDSGYSWLLTQWALGHKHIASTRHYLRSRLWRSFSESKLREAQTAILGQLEVGDLDLTLLRCKLDLGFEPSKADRARLAAYRAQVKRDELTPSGYRCGSPMAPPPQMDPGNPGDGTIRARCGTHCPVCPVGLAVDPNYMVKTLVSLRLVRRGMSIAAWNESQFSAELDMLQRDLSQWPAEDVAALIEYWAVETTAGREVIPAWAGLN